MGPFGPCGATGVRTSACWGGGRRGLRASRPESARFGVHVIPSRPLGHPPPELGQLRQRILPGPGAWFSKARPRPALAGGAWPKGKHRILLMGRRRCPRRTCFGGNSSALPHPGRRGSGSAGSPYLGLDQSRATTFRRALPGGFFKSLISRWVSRSSIKSGRSLTDVKPIHPRPSAKRVIPVVAFLSAGSVALWWLVLRP